MLKKQYYCDICGQEYSERNIYGIRFNSDITFAVKNNPDDSQGKHICRYCYGGIALNWKQMFEKGYEGQAEHIEEIEARRVKQEVEK
jgi:hypothetical protein